jgi:hypothetical protein
MLSGVLYAIITISCFLVYIALVTTFWCTPSLTCLLNSQKFYKLKKEAAEIQKFETPERCAPKGDRKSTSTGAKRKREKNVEASRETPSKPSKKQMTPLDLDALAADDDGETKPYSKGPLKMEVDEDEEMEDEGRNAEEAWGGEALETRNGELMRSSIAGARWIRFIQRSKASTGPVNQHESWKLKQEMTGFHSVPHLHFPSVPCLAQVL